MRGTAVLSLIVCLAHPSPIFGVPRSIQPQDTDTYSMRSSGALLKVDSSTGSWNVSVNGQLWFEGQGVKVTHNDVTYISPGTGIGITSSGSTELDAPAVSTFTGADRLGTFQATQLTYEMDANVTFVTTFKAYDDNATIVFEQSFPQGLESTGPGRVNLDKLITAFPNIHITDPEEPRGYLQLLGGMMGSYPHMGSWNADSSGIGSRMIDTAPLIVFNEDAEVAAVWSAAASFMVVNQNVLKDESGGRSLAYGLLGSITSVPAGFRSAAILSFGSGINNAMKDWGSKLLRLYGNKRQYTEGDMTVNTLGYSTDNGAYYYYFTEGDMNYDETLRAVQADANKSSLPLRHILLDSWWYYQGPRTGVTQWDPRPDVFPDGLESFYQATHWPSVAHNRWWSKDNVYATQNGGQYKFIVEPENAVAIPTDQQFWDDLMLNHTSWGLKVYEQDWLYNETVMLNATLNSATLSREWLMQMGAGAQKAGLTIQARASGDYHPGTNSQWKLGVTAMFANAVGIRPSKDNWWSSPEPTWQDKGKDRETRNRLQSAVSIMSRGPYTPGDKIGSANVALIMRGCMADGTLLHADRAATNIDANILHRANGSWSGPNGEVWSSETTLGPGLTFYHILAVEVGENYGLLPKHLGANGGFLVVEANNTAQASRFDSATQLTIHRSDEWSFEFFSVAPKLPNNWTLIGEVDKWIKVSAARFSEVQWFQSDGKTTALAVTVHGTPGETVNVGFVGPDTTSVVVVACKLSANTATLTMPDKQCR